VLQASQPIHGLVEGGVAGDGRHALDPEIGGPEGGQDADEQHLDAHLARLRDRPIERLVDLPLHPAQAIARQPQRLEVELEIEAAQLGGEVGVAQRLDQLEVARRRHAVGVDEEELLLGPDAADVGLDPVLLEEALERPEVGEQPSGEELDGGGVTG
jgi:hypothetical protein